MRAFESKNVQFTFGHSILTDEQGIVRRELIAHLPSLPHETHATNLFTGSLFFRAEEWIAFSRFSLRYKYAFEYEIIKALFARGGGALINSRIAGFRIHEMGISSRLRDQMKEETTQIFVDRKKKNKASIFCGRIFYLATQKSLLRAIRGRFFSEIKGNHWRTVFDDSSVVCESLE